MANFNVDEEEYMEASENVWSNECYAGYDKETDTTYHHTTFPEWYTKHDGIAPLHRGEYGEIDVYRPQLTLN